MPSFRCGRRAAGVLTALALVLCCPIVAAQEPPNRGRILDLLRAGDGDAALPLLRTYADAHPGDAVMLYNLACGEAGAGRPEAAVAAIRACLAAGFEDLDRLTADPDLAPLRDHPGFRAVLTEEGGRLVLLARERGADLEEGRRVGPLRLLRRDDPLGDAPDLHLRWSPLGLELELTAGGVWADLAGAGATPPWQGGPSVAVTLAVPGQTPSYSSRNAWILAFGLEQKRPVGALFLAGRGHWQRIVELDPQLETNEAGGVVFGVTVPWRTIRPFHPLVDTRLGLNVAVRVPRRDGSGFHVAELVPDPARFDPSAPLRRTAVLTFDPASIAAEAFVGRIGDSVVREGTLRVDLTAVARTAGRGAVSLDFLDAGGRSVLPGGAQGGGLDLVLGVNRVTRTADFSGLRTGTYQLRAELVFPAGARADWSTTILHLPSGWDTELADRVAALPEHDRPTANHLLELVRDALARHVPRRHPGAIATTLGQLTSLLDRAETTGSLLPKAGAFTLVAPAPSGERLVEGFLSPEGAAVGAHLPVLVLSDAAGQEDFLLRRMARFDSGQPAADGSAAPALAYLVPRLSAADTDPAAEAVALLDWTRDYFATPAVLVVGVDALADEALTVAARRPDAVAALAVFAGSRVGLPEDLDDLRADLPLSWLAFPKVTAVGGDAVRLRGLLAERGLGAVVDQEVRGGLSLSQVGDRSVLWAREAAAHVR